MNSNAEPTRAEIDALEAPAVLEFGATWCGWCQAAQADIASALSAHPHVRHLKIEDGKGRRLGRSFGVKLWPTLVLMNHGEEIARVVRPRSAREIEALFDSMPRDEKSGA